MNKKFVVYGVVMTLLLCVGMSYAYFSGMITGEGKEIRVSAKELRILFTDDMELANSTIIPGWKETKTFSVKNESGNTFNYNISIKDLINTFVSTGYLQYKITSTSGYNMTEYLDIPKSSEKTHVTLAYGIEIEAGITHNYTIEFIYHDSPEDQSMDMGKIFNGTLSIEEGTEDPSYLRGKILADHPTRPGARPNLNSGIYQDENTGTLYTASGNQTENGETVYYFAGNALDNWVYFAGIYWRIVRINEDGSVRLLYVGPDKNTEEGYIGTSAYNTNSNDPRYVGYMYGSAGSLANNRNNTTDSTIKGVIDTWYDSAIEPNYNGYVSKTAVYCNDRANSGTAVLNRLASHAPSYKCGNDVNGNLYTGADGADVADKFTVSTSTGNGNLTNPASLMTADEVAFAGGKWDKNSEAYYFFNASGGSVTVNVGCWTMSPHNWNGTSSSVYVVDKYGALKYTGPDNPVGVRPVLSLKSCVKWKSGEGTSESPYEVDIDNTCAEKDEKPKYNLSVNITGGTVKPSNVIVPEGESRTFTVTANEGYTLDNPAITCTGGAATSMSGGALTIGDVMLSQTCTVVLKTIPSLKDQILADHPTRPGDRPNLNGGIYQEENTETLYTASGNVTEGGKTVYYFSGNALDNWVYFAGIYWRVIRINEDGSIRLLYVGPDKNTTKGCISTSTPYNATCNESQYAGYMYGSSGSFANNRKNTTDSTVKEEVDMWYNSKIKPSYNGYVSKTAIYCNDRANDGTSTTEKFYYAANKRLVDAQVPSYKCGNDVSGSLFPSASDADKFTASTSIGNGKLTNPVALMTADEVVFAGGTDDAPAKPYYYSNASGESVTGNTNWWTMSPKYYNWRTSSVPDVIVFYVINYFSSKWYGYLNSVNCNGFAAVRPVLSLKSCVKWKNGDGTSDNPYIVDTLDSTCSAAEN